MQALLPLPYLSHQPGLAVPGQLVLADVSVQPVAQIQVLVIPRDDQVDCEGWGTETKSSREGSIKRNVSSLSPSSHLTTSGDTNLASCT